MKKRLLITSALMTAVLGASLATGTYAWYSATEAAGKTLATETNNTLKTATNAYSAGGFTVTPTFVSITGNPVLTDDSGKTYYYAGEADGAEIPDGTPQNGDKYATVVVGLTIKYEGASSTPADILALWDSLANSAQVTVTLSDVSEGLASGAGLKFWTEAPAGSEYAGNATATVTFDTSSLTFAADGTASGIGAASNSIYVGAKGVNDVLQTAEDVYTMHAATSLTGA